MSLLQELFGSKPDVPALRQFDLGQEQGKAAAANLANVPAASKLAGATTDQITSMLSKVLGTNFGGLQSDIGKVISSELHGEIPQDVQDLIQNNAAVRALSGGTSGSQFAGNITARSLGLTSLDLINKGMSSAEAWINQAEQISSPGMAAFTNMFVTPQQQASFDQNQEEMQFQRQWMQNQVDAQPDPTAVGLLSTLSTLNPSQMIESLMGGSSVSGINWMGGAMNPKGAASGSPGASTGANLGSTANNAMSAIGSLLSFL